MSNARNLADLLETDGDVKVGHLDSVVAPSKTTIDALGIAATSVTGSQATAITNNTAKTGITSSQATAITANTAKTGITSGQASAITANTAKTGITSAQASEITANNAKVTNYNQTKADIEALGIVALPAGGTVGQIVTNTGSGTGIWQDAAPGGTTLLFDNADFGGL